MAVGSIVGQEMPRAVGRHHYWPLMIAIFVIRRLTIANNHGSITEIIYSPYEFVRVVVACDRGYSGCQVHLHSLNTFNPSDSTLRK